MYLDPLGSLSFDDIPEAAPLLGVIAFTSYLATGDQNPLIGFEALLTDLANAYRNGTCVGSCYKQGNELVQFVIDHNNLSLTALSALLTPPSPPPAPDPPAPTFVIGSSPMPVQLGPPVAAQPTLPCVGAGTGGAAGSPTGLALLPQPGLLASVPQFTFDALGNLVSQDGSGVVSHDGGSLVSENGGAVLASAGDTVLVNGRAYVVSHDGGSLISQDGSGIIVVPSAAGILSDNTAGLFGGINNLFQNSNSFFGNQ
jgi:hypothetical protein